MALVQTAIEASQDFAEYHKIDTLFERDPATFIVNPTTLRKPVIGTIAEWDVTEKIDGTNVRVMIGTDGEVRLGGRTNKAQLPGDLLNYLARTFTAERMREVFWLSSQPTAAVIYGEGYGAGIQKGGCYRPDKGFIVFDVLVSGKWWLDWYAVQDIAAKFEVPTVPYLGRWTLNRIVESVRVGVPSVAGSGIAEGIVARPIETLFDKRGERLIIKLKTKDFVAGRR